MRRQKTIDVWDSFIRVFHWSLASLFVISYLSGEEELWLHPWSGYAIVTLLLSRIVWGFIGTKHARFSDFVYSPTQIISYAKGLISGDAKRHIGHNPLGGLMIIVLLASLLMTATTGMLLYGAEEGKGPLAGVMAQQSSIQLPQLISTAHADDDEHENTSGKKSDDEHEFLEETHEFFANFTLLLVMLHLVGVFVGSVFHKESLVKAMLSGKKRARL